MEGATLVTSNQKVIVDALKDGIRMDGRSPYDYRSIRLTFGTDGYGRCEAQLGSTRVLANISAEVVRPHAHNPTDGFLHFNTTLSPMASPLFEVGRLSDEEVMVSRLLEKALRKSRAIDTEGLCIVAGEKVWSIRIDVRILNHEGNLIDCALIAAISALLHFRRPNVSVEGETVTVHTLEDAIPVPLSVHHIPIAISFGFFNNVDIIVVDPSHLEEQVMDGDMTVVVNAHREVCALSKSGGAPLDIQQIVQCTEVAAVKATEVTEIIRNALAKTNEKESKIKK